MSISLAAPGVPVAKAEFKARALEYLRQVEATGQALVITDHGRPVVRIIPHHPDGALDTAQGTWARRVAEGEVRYDADAAVAPLPAGAWGDLA
jgi:prevent-host-death family protein